MAKTSAKSRTAYVCTECGADHSKWQGQCADCGAWNSLSEIVLETAAGAPAAARRSGWAGKAEAPRITALKDVRHSEEARELCSPVPVSERPAQTEGSPQAQARNRPGSPRRATQRRVRWTATTRSRSGR